jgi:hypothetical protein
MYKHLALSLLLVVNTGCARPPRSVPDPAARDRRVQKDAWDVRLPSVYKFQDNQFALAEPFKLLLPGRSPIGVPRGFVTDYASIPGPLRRFFRGRHDLPALVHDYLYWRQCPQDAADAIFYEALTAMQLTPGERDLMYTAVRDFGAKALRNNVRERAAGLPRVIPGDSLPPRADDWKHLRAGLQRDGVSLDSLDAAPPSDCP